MSDVEITEAQETMMRGDVFSPIVHIFGKPVDFDNPRAASNYEVLVKTQPYLRLETTMYADVNDGVRDDGKSRTKELGWRCAILVQKGRFWEGEVTQRADGTCDAKEVSYDRVPQWAWDQISEMSETGWHYYLLSEKTSIEELKRKGPPPLIEPDEGMVNYERIKLALEQLDHKNPNHWTKDGTANINTLRQLTKMEITKADLSAFGEELTKRKIIKVKLPGTLKK